MGSLRNQAGARALEERIDALREREQRLAETDASPILLALCGN
jgi:hypothetical protein